MKPTKKIKSPVTKGVAKVPVVMQMEALECGAASLAMILAYYEKWIPLRQVFFSHISALTAACLPARSLRPVQKAGRYP